MRGRDPPRGTASLAAICAIVVGLVGIGSLVAVPSHPLGHPAAVAPSQGSFRSWNNGVVSLSFPRDRPTFSLASMTNSAVFANQSISTIAEIAPNRSIVSIASLSNAVGPWKFAEFTSSLATMVNLTGRVTAYPGGGEWESGDDLPNSTKAIGFANITIQFFLNGSSGQGPRSVEYDLAISGWPWLQSNDSLGIEVRSTGNLSMGSWQPNGSNALDEFSHPGNDRIAAFDWAGSATAYYGSGPSEDSSIQSYRNLSFGGADYSIRLSFGAVSGGYYSLAYDPTLTLFIPAHGTSRLPAWLLTQSSLEILAAGAVVCAILALVAGVRRRPPDEGL